jgi:hypothetical protein
MPRNFPAYSVCLLLASFCFIPLLAHAVPQSLPDSVTHANTIFIANETGYNELAYTLVLELSKWGRFDLVDSREKADLILRLDNGNHVRALPDGQYPGTNAFADSGPAVPKGYTRIALLDPKTNAMLWSDTHKTEGGKVKSGHLLDGLREAFDSHDKSRR